MREGFYMLRRGVSADIIGLKSCLEGNLEFLGSRLVWFKNRELDQLPNWEI